MLTVAEKLLDEADRLGLRVIQNWEEERRIKKKVSDMREYRFPGLGGPKRKPTTGRGGVEASPMVGAGDESKVDPREVDALLAELSMMSGRWQLLRRFLYGRLKASSAFVCISTWRTFESDLLCRMWTTNPILRSRQWPPTTTLRRPLFPSRPSRLSLLLLHQKMPTSK